MQHPGNAEVVHLPVDAAIKYLQEFVASQPGSKAAAGALAQFYVEQKRYGDARDVLQKLWDEDKSSKDLEFGVAWGTTLAVIGWRLRSLSRPAVSDSEPELSLPPPGTS